MSGLTTLIGRRRVSDLPTPEDVPGTSDFAFVQDQIRRDREYDELAARRERRDANRMRAIAARHPSAQDLSTTEDAGRRIAAAVVDIHFAAPPTVGVEPCESGAVPPPPPTHLLRTPPPKGIEL